MTTDPFTPLSGRCRCEQLLFQLGSAPMITHCCHCRTCQRASGSAFGTIAMIESRHVTVLAGKTRVFEGVHEEKQLQCAECASVLWIHRADLGDAVALVRVGMLDDPNRLTPEAHYFVRSKQTWLTLPPGVPAFETLGDAGKAGFRERIQAALGVPPGPAPSAG